MGRYHLKRSGGAVTLVLLLSLLLSLGMVMPVAAQDSMVRSCSPVKGTDLIEPQVAAGEATSFALREDQKLWGWGIDNYGQVGNGKIIVDGDERNGQETPYLLTEKGFNEGFKQVAAGRWHTLAVKNDGTVWGWGNNEKGQLGNLPLGPHSTPQQIPNLQNMKAVACGEFFSLALNNDGTVWAWGNNDGNELGRGATGPFYNNPEKVKGPGGTGYLDNVTAIACGRFHGLALKSDGTVWAWGDGSWGTLGNGEDFSEEVYPVRVLNLTGVKSIDAGDYFSLALKNDGTVWAWGGRGIGGQLGDGEVDDFVNIPQQVKGLNGLGNLNNVEAITCGINHSLALKDNGTILAWGENYGRLGDGDATSSESPVPVLTQDISGVVAIAAGGEHSLARKNDGTVWAWGSNHHYQLTGDNDSGVPVQVEGIPLLAKPLISLSVKAADGGPELLTCFISKTTGYKMTVENPLEAVKITPVPVSGATASVKLNGVVQNDGIVNLAVDPEQNKVEVVVSESGKDDLTYNIDIRRLRLADPLTDLSVRGKADGSGNEYLTGFSGTSYAYNVAVENNIDAVKVVPTAVSGATTVIKLNGVPQNGGVISNLAIGWDNRVDIVVIQEDRTDRKYTIEIGRKPNWKQGYENWPVEVQKTWTIKFNQAVKTTEAAKYIYVKDAQGTKVPLKDFIWSDNNTTVKVQAQSAYNTGAKYTLHIETALESAQGTPLNAAIAMPFKIE
ncbi:cadherin-like beta sandwich domain-containing protein [Syntrophomonas wolfei]|uniref:Alpha-tubulin suppressor and related RCC1 domain-containing proteins-like protein n=1 Tax=Syntrophomonas wolfei subsp. wolfei (strain DSM 2245B / Goettingen) TaxID=335541 RepID=Q0B0J1_SYNWW|nr:cadherin-like beta sandwich domain-containing protein [Syntrophomonas wolfei]ABI67513.1 Alpha-tubulin suppressor and related RCC1 domain-containing proteins-like protein [Syntrophomonas wolfei subsp. wolfei str. Goettingen G311]